MNDEQRAVLAAIHRMEESPGTLIDEYTVARAAGILPTDLNGHEYIQSAVRAQIHHILDELDVLGLVRLDREGYWRPRTTLSGRRSLQRPLVALPTQRPTLVPPSADSAEGAAVDDDYSAGRGAAPSARSKRWPGWWPAPLRFGDPALTPIVAPVALVLALLLIVVVVTQAQATRQAAATATAVAAVAAPTPAAQLPPPLIATTPAGAPKPAGGAGSPIPVAPTRPPPAPTVNNRAPTPTAGPATARVMVANTDNKGANVFVLPAGERRFAIPEGFILDVIGPDQRDTQGRNWKHIQYENFQGWIPEEYTTPVN